MGWPLPWKPKLIVDCSSLCLRHTANKGKKKYGYPSLQLMNFLGVLKGWSVTTALEIVIKALYVSECAWTSV